MEVCKVKLSGTIEWKELYHSGKANNVYLTNNPEYLELEAQDRISAGNGAKIDIISGKGIANNVISKAIFAKLEEHGIHTHYVGPGSNPASKIVKKTTPILLEVIGRFKATGSYVKQYDVPNMLPFDGVYIEYTYKLINSYHKPKNTSAIVYLNDCWCCYKLPIEMFFSRNVAIFYCIGTR